MTTDDRAYCWGMNHIGQLGNGSLDNSAVPVAVAGGLRFRQVEAGGGHACGVTSNDRLFCWGWNVEGQLGDGTSNDRHAPVEVAGSRRFRQVSAGQYHTCAITTTDQAYCWGHNGRGQVGSGTTERRHRRPVKVNHASKFQVVSAGALHSCGVTKAGKAFCWGAGGSGQLGNNQTGIQRSPVAVVGGLSFILVVAGETQRTSGYHSCGVTTENKAYCWGGNGDGQLGDGSTTRRMTPTAVAGGIRFAQINASADHTCGVSTGNVAYCWGFNYYGALGDGGPLGAAANVHLTPFPVAGGLALKSVTAGRVHSCGTTTSGAAYCWGGNTAGQLGDGDPDFATSTPVAVVGPS